MNRQPPQPDSSGKVTVGWREYVALPDWGVSRIKAKIDTGARTSALDVSDLQELPGGRVRFDIVVDRLHPQRRVTVETPVVRRTRVRSSFGATHERLVVSTTMVIGPVQKEVELSLVSRQHMLCRMLIGRKSLAPDLLVDSSRRYVVGRRRTAPAPER